MTFTRTTYCGSPCWQLATAWLSIDANWNTRFPYGTSFFLHAGRQPPPRVHTPACSRGRIISAPDIAGCQCPVIANKTPGFCLDLNAPLGEPNRLYLMAGKWHAILGLPSLRAIQDTGEKKAALVSGREILMPVIRHVTGLRHLHADGCSRYRYHREEGRWVRNQKPEPLHWGWLTITRRDDD